MTKPMFKITYRWQTVCITGFSRSVSREENRAAHGGVCLCQARKTRDGKYLGRLVNSNGRHGETGESFELSEERLNDWINY